MSNDYLPTKEADRVTFLVNLMDVCAGHCIGSPPPRTPAWTWISTAELSTVKELIQDYRDKYDKAMETRAPADLAGKDVQAGITVPKAREFIKKNLTQEQIGVEGRVECNLPVRDTTPTPVPVPTAGPDSVSMTSPEAPGVIRIRYKGAKPTGVISCEIGYGILEAAPENADSLPKIDTFTHNPWVKTFGDDRAKKFFYALRWRVSGGAASPWSEIKEVVVP